MLVVMILLGLAAAVVLPALVTPPHDTAPLRDLIATTREAAADRGEVLYLRIDAGGAWRLQSADPLEGTLEHGRLPWGEAPLTLIVSPLGSCAPDVASAASGAGPPLDALGCDLLRPAARSGP